MTSETETPDMELLCATWQGAPKSLVKKVVNCIEDVNNRVAFDEVALVLVEARHFYEWRFNTTYLRETPSYDHQVSDGELTAMVRHFTDEPDPEDGPLMTRSFVTYLRQRGLHDMLQAKERMPLVLCAQHRQIGWTLFGYLRGAHSYTTTIADRTLH